MKALLPSAPAGKWLEMKGLGAQQACAHCQRRSRRRRNGREHTRTHATRISTRSNITGMLWWFPARRCAHWHDCMSCSWEGILPGEDFPPLARVNDTLYGPGVMTTGGAGPAAFAPSLPKRTFRCRTCAASQLMPALPLALALPVKRRDRVAPGVTAAALTTAKQRCSTNGGAMLRAHAAS